MEFDQKISGFEIPSSSLEHGHAKEDTDPNNYQLSPSMPKPNIVVDDSDYDLNNDR